MHPAYSVILFTTASGAGYGLLFWLGLGALVAPGPATLVHLAALALGLVLVTAGLLSSTFHLGHPERAWRAFSQWRSSWLSREGVASVATYVPAGLLGLAWLLDAPGLAAASGVFLAAGCVATVWCTGMIYACLRTVPAWHGPGVAAAYLALAGGTGGLLAALLRDLAGGEARVLAALSALSFLVALGLKIRAWRRAREGALGYDTLGALGIPGLAAVRPLDPPHTQPNFVMREMGYAVARRHADRLRALCLALLFAVPLALLALALALPGEAAWLLAAALPAAAAGVLIERWLFFAEARHLSMLYYPAAAA